MSHVLIIGAGHAGANAAAMLRQSGFAGEVTLISEEAVLPYQRPPLSKAWLKGETSSEALALRPASFYEKSNVTLRLSSRAQAIDRAAKVVVLEGGERIAYDKLIIATGARARRLPLAGADSPSVHELRNVADADRLKAGLAAAKRIAIIGGGYIGLEVAASARALGVDVVILEREARVLARVANPLLSGFFTDYHRARGVEIRTGVEIAGFDVDGDRFNGVRLADGSLVAADCALVGVGAIPNDELARAAGLKCELGVCVDEVARTSDADIYAIGDVTWRPLPLYQRHGRLESVPNALEQARMVAADIAGKPLPAGDVPWFWSDQYDLKLQIAGLAFGDESIIVRGDPASAKFALFHLDGGVVRAVEAVNSPAEFMAAKPWILAGKAVDPQRLADVSIPIKEVAP